jgi:alanyl-tRNA synthetase
MATERLYYSDSFLRTFEARVLSCTEADGHYQVILDRTAFYPTSGGQPNDQGMLDGVKVIDVLEQEATGDVVHVTESPVLGNSVAGIIDWARRQDHMQQHSGQHILSAAFVEVCDVPTVGFHLGGEISTIDLQTTLSVPDRLGEVIRLANQVVFEDREVRVLNMTPEQAGSLRLRKESDREGMLRIVAIPEFDLSPCGGTHVSFTGQVGLVLTRKVERYKQGWRVEFVCGGRALREAQNDFQYLTRAAKLLSCPPNEIPALIEKHIGESKSFRRERTNLLNELAAYQAKDLLTEAQSVGDKRLLLKSFQSGELEFVKMLAHHAAQESSTVVVFTLATEKPQVLISTSVDSGVDASQLFKICAQQFPLKGGGSRISAQGSMPAGSDVEGVLQFVRQNFAD